MLGVDLPFADEAFLSTSQTSSNNLMPRAQ